MSAPKSATPSSATPSPATPNPPVAFDLDAIGAGLVFATSLPDLETTLTEAAPAGTAVVQAPPGTGKTTLVPPLVANLCGTRHPASARVVVTQPRRVAARAAARRLATLDGSQLGDRVGFTVRGEHHAGPNTIVEFVTPGILLRRLLADPALDGVAAVVLDEVHERGLETDLLIGMLTEVHQLRNDLTLLAMSATLDAPRFAALLGRHESPDPAPIIDCPSALHPLEVRWAPPTRLRMDERGVTRNFLTHVADTAAAAHRQALTLDDSVDTLVFLPGAWEVSQVAGRLRGPVSPEVLELHGQVSAAEQDRAISGRVPGDPPRIIVATSLAESSLTVPGVRLVVDAGLAREPRRDSTRQMTGLVTVTASRASADQRAGRAARQGPGTVVRCYDQNTYRSAPAHPTPEAAVADLTGAVLALACWGSPGGAGLSLPDALPAAALSEAVAVLNRLGAIDADGRATALGQQLSRVPADPRLGRALLDGTRMLSGGRKGAGQNVAAQSVAAQSVAAQSVAAQSVAAQSVAAQSVAAQTVAMVESEARAPGADLTRLLAELRSGRNPAARSWDREVKRLREIANRQLRDQATTHTPASPPASRDEEVGYVVALAFPDQVARRVPPESGQHGSGQQNTGQHGTGQHGTGQHRAGQHRAGQHSTGAGASYLLARGTRAGLPADSPLAGQEWLAIAEVSRARGRDAAGTGAVIRAAAPLGEAAALAAAEHLLVEEVVARFSGGRVIARKERRLGGITLESTPVRPSPADGRTAVERAVRSQGLDLFSWLDPATALRRRLALLHRELGEPWPAMDEHSLLQHLPEWLGPEIDELARGASVRSIDLLDPLRRLLPWPTATRLGELAPERLEVPSGSRVRIDYPPIDEVDGRPVVAVKLQECFGLSETPRLADGRVPVLFHLLSPAGRPLAVTDDLASFWSGPYAQVRAEMRGRYPKHPWPQDPWSAPATARTKKKM